MATCSIDGCEKPVYARRPGRGWCVTHYRRWMAHGDPLVVKNGRGKPIVERFMDRVSKDPSGCWLWTAGTNDGGYGRFRPDRASVTQAAHRWSYSHFVGPIPDGFSIDHLCRVRLCVNPEHLEAVTPRTNVLRAESVVAANAAKTHCPRGHTYDSINSDGSRGCRVCKNATAVASRNRVRART